MNVLSLQMCELIRSTNIYYFMPHFNHAIFRSIKKIKKKEIRKK